MGIDSLQDLRDVTIIAFAIAGTVLFLAAIVVTAVVGVAATAAFQAVRRLVQERIGPAVDNVRGTIAFISDTTVSPIIRAYGLFAGVRRGLAVLSGLGQRGEGKGSRRGRKR